MRWIALLVALAALGLFFGCLSGPEPVASEPSRSSLTLSLDEEGATIAHRGSRLSFRTGGPAKLTRGPRAVYHHADFDEWYEVRPDGVEQGFDVPARPRGQALLRIPLALGDLVVAPTSTPALVDLEDAHHVRVFRYGALAARDATGKALTARFSFTPGEARIAIDVDDHDARYPVAIDPLVWALQRRLQRIDAGTRDQLGNAVAIGGADELIASAVGAHAFAGGAFALREENGGWAEYELSLPDAGARQGVGATLAVSGDRMLVGSSFGAIELQRDAGGWGHSGTLVVPRGTTRPGTGLPVALDGDRAAILLGSPEPDALDGGANPELYLFERSDLAWKVVGSFSLPAPLTVTDSGRRLAFGGDDLVVGTGREVRIYRRNAGGAWAFEAALLPDLALTPAANFQGLGFGRAVAIDGDTMLVTDQETAALYVYERRDGTWTFSQFLRVENRLSDDGFGSEVAIRGDLAWVGLPRRSSGGSVFRYRRVGGTWSLEEEVQPADLTTSAAFGSAIATDGKRTVIGDPGQGGSRGALYVYELSSTLGEPCTSASSCASGLCVDGVCCASSCGEGRPDDCLACNAKGSEGTCTVATTATICRPARDACDVSEACDGTSSACPGDRVAPSGAACPAGVCQAGSCVEVPDASPVDGSAPRETTPRSAAASSGCAMSHGARVGLWPFVLAAVLAALRRRQWLAVAVLAMLVVPSSPIELTSGDGRISMQFAGDRREAIDRRTGDRLAVDLRRFGRVGELRDAPACEPHREGARVSCDREGVREWFEARPDGLEHGFDVASPPAGTGELVFEIATAGGGLDYGDLVAFDAQGRVLPARMIARSIGVELRVDDRDARYPIVVDPRIWRRRQRLDPPFPRPGYGRAVAIHGDRLAVGQSGSSSVVIYRRDGAGWTIDGSAVPLEAQIDRFQFGAALAWAGETLVVGAGREIDKTTRAGAVFLFDRDAGGRWYQAARFDLPDGNPIAIGGDLFGFAVAADGDTIIVGAPYTDITSPTILPLGAAFVFVKEDGGWTRRAKLSNPAVQNLGRVVAVSGDVILAGTFLPDPTRRPASDLFVSSVPLTAHVFVRADSAGRTWTETVLDSPAGNDLYGAAIATDGDDVFVGMPSVLGRRAAVFVYRRTGTEWKLVQELTAPEEVDLFGQSLAVHGDRLVVGAPLGGDAKGFVHVFERDSKGRWTQTSRLTADDLAIDDRFGGALDFDDELLVVGAPEHQHGAGAAYSFFLGQQGDACVNGSVCASGLCVDGVCCADACGGGDTSDCLACSVAAGGSIDGECTPATRTVCRPARDECDLAESCDGTNAACPADVTAVNGTACRETGACYAGECVDVLPISNVDAGVAPPPPVAPAADGCAIGRGSARASSSFIALTLLFLLWRRKKDP